MKLTMASAAMVGRGRPIIVSWPIRHVGQLDDLVVDDIPGRHEKIRPLGASQWHLEVGLQSVTFSCFCRYGLLRPIAATAAQTMAFARVPARDMH